jgi:benzoate/toluate 1,2-dioxygenase beta subunit
LSVAASRPSLERIAAVTAFVCKEARLIDERKFEEWASLFTHDGLYWVPLTPGQSDHLNEMSIIKDDRGMLDARVARLRHPEAHADIPAVRSVHMLSNIELVSEADAETQVAAALMMTEWRDNRQTHYAGRVQWTLVALGADGFAIRLKRVELVNCDGFHQQITVPF